MTEKSPQRNFPEKLTVAENFKVLTPDEFRRDFYDEAVLAVTASPNHEDNLAFSSSQRPSMGLEAMWVEFYGHHQRAIYASALKALKAGFEVEILKDYLSDTILDGEHVSFPLSLLLKKERKAHRNWVSDFNKKRWDTLKEKGAKITSVNMPGSLIGKATYLLRGRDHKKIIFIKTPERMVAWMGGMNLAEEHFRQVDFMVKIDDPTIVQRLIDEFHRTGENKRETNAEIRATNETTILVDTGKEKSLILQQALEDVDQAGDTIYALSAFVPSGEFLKALVRAKERRVHIVYITSNKGLTGLQGKVSDIKTGRKDKISIMFPEKDIVHAKTLVVDEKIVIFGSHNFIDMPHEELSLRSINPTLVKNITEFLENASGGNLGRELREDFIIPASI